MSNKQSSVEWLAKSYVDLLTELNDDKISLTQFEIRYIEILEQAKAIHKEEIIKSSEAGFDDGNGFVEEIKYKNAEHYYNETFGGGNK